MTFAQRRNRRTMHFPERILSLSDVRLYTDFVNWAACLNACYVTWVHTHLQLPS